MSTRNSTRRDTSPPGIEWAAAFAAGAMQAQRLQIEALVLWQAAMAAICNEIWDEWRCRFAGGAPIDG